MASSRWKRFAFFDRHTLSFPSEVLEDLVPVGSADKEGRRSIRSLTIGREVSSNDSVSLVVTTASLPFASKPKQVDDEVFNESKKEDALDAMWSSLVACTSADVPHDNNAGEAKQPLVQLPSQRQLSQGNGNKRETSVNSVDGLVLAFVTSRDTELIHCFDVTVRCNPPPAAEKDLEDLDGWRGYFAPFSAICTRAQDGPASDDADGDKVVGIAACRHNKGNGPVHLACISDKRVVVWEDPHIHLSCRQPLTQPRPSSDVKTYTMQHPLSSSSEGHCLVVDIVPGIVAVGMDTGAVLIYVYTDSRPNLRTFLKIPPPPADGVEVVAVKMALTEPRANIFVAYRLAANATPQMSSAAGVCCYEMPIPGNNMTTLSAPSARHDLDGRYVGSSSLVDAATYASGMQLGVARPDGVYSYSRTERTGVAPIDGTKLAFCVVPPPIPAEKTRDVSLEQVASGYSLVASTDAKSGRDAVDLYDSMNKLVAYHLLLSPGHRALRAAGVTTMPTVCNDGSVRGGRSSAVILTSGGNIVTLTEKLTEEKIDLLVQKNLYSAAIVVAYADPSYEAANITDLYCQHAEYLYRKGDFSGSMEQYCHTIGSLESSHVIFRFLDAPKIPLLVKYLEKLRALHIATAVHNELLRTCYLKLNDTEAADAIAASASSSRSNASMSSILSNLSNNPKDALVTICSLEAEPAAEILVVHGPSLARVLPRETAGIVIALCLGTYSPKNLADAALIDPGAVKRMIERGTDDRPKQHEQYPFHLFSSAFLENPKMLRLILTHCNRNKCYLTPFLRRTLLELTLAEWNQARRSGDKEAERLRYKEVIAALTDSHSKDIGDHDALVIVQTAGFREGELLLYERLQMTPMLLERYAKDGSEKSRRQMLAMSQSEPELLADVLGHFVEIASEKLNESRGSGDDNTSENSEAEDILDDIREALTLAKRQSVLPPVRVARILAGEGTGQFSAEATDRKNTKRRTVPLSVALDYVGSILEDSRKEASRLSAEVEEYNELCNSMETEIDSLLRASNLLPSHDGRTAQPSGRLNIDEFYAKVKFDDGDLGDNMLEQPLEAFWRDMNQSEDTFDTIARFFAKGVIH